MSLASRSCTAYNPPPREMILHDLLNLPPREIILHDLLNLQPGKDVQHNHSQPSASISCTAWP